MSNDRCILLTHDDKCHALKVKEPECGTPKCHFYKTEEMERKSQAKVRKRLLGLEGKE